MLEFLKKVFNLDERRPEQRALPRALARKKPARRRPPAARTDAELDVRVEGGIEERGPGKNVLIRKRLVREEAGTHDTLKIVDESGAESGEESGIDPYNTGNFDRSRHWDKRFRL